MIKRDQKGITMVSLVVTIIVLLILAGVSIYFITGDNGIIKNAKKARNETYQEMVNEEVEQIVAEYEISNTGETLEEFLKKKVPERLDEVTRIDDDKIEVKKDGYSVILDAKSEASNNKVKINASSYTGIYDGNEHATITSITTEPSDAKIEYSTDGTNYSETIPTITNASTVSVTIRASKDGYEAGKIIKTAIVNKAEGRLTLSDTKGTYTYLTSGTFTVSDNTGAISATSNNTNIATVSVEGNTITVQPGATSGKVTITVTSAETENYTAKSATYEATVNNVTISLNATPYTGTYDGKAHNALTNVTVTPNDAKIEYSTDEKTYTTTMPTITNASSVTITIRASKEGYTTATIKQTAKVNKADWSITLSETSGTLTYPQATSFTVSGNVGVLSVASSNTNIATANITENSVDIQSGTTEGQAKITVTSGETDNYNAASAIYTVDVKNGEISLSAVPYTGTYDGEAHEALTNVKVEPSDSKLEYSIDGLNYIDTIPTVTNATTLNVTIKATKAGYGMQSITETVKINKADGAITLSETSGAYTYPTVGTFKVSDNTGVLSATSSNSNIATATAVGNIVTVKPGTTAGKATITVTSTESINYTAKSATYEATVENGTIKLIVTPYDGAYNGETHDAIKSVVVSPIDATVEYSTDGKNFTTTKPTIKEVSTVTVTVKASKEGYKTEIATETINVKELIDAIKIGDYVNYTYDDADPYSIDNSISGALLSQSIIQSKLLKWRILKIDRTNNTIDLIGDPTVQELELGGASGYNNGVFLLNDICEKLYSNSSLNVKARSINLKDVEGFMTSQGVANRNAYVHTWQSDNSSTVYTYKYGQTDTTKLPLRRYYPKLYASEIGAGINTTAVSQPDISKGNDPYNESSSIYTSGTTETDLQAGSVGLTVSNTNYIIPVDDTNFGDVSAILANDTTYWIAARATLTDPNIAGFGIRYINTNTDGAFLYSSNRLKLTPKHPFRPYVTLKLDTLSGTKNLLGQWELK